MSFFGFTQSGDERELSGGIWKFIPKVLALNPYSEI